jgi:hypothetical protein
MLKTLPNYTVLPCRDFDAILQNVLSNGLILEFGVGSGETLNQIARVLPDRTVFGFDWFRGLPENWSSLTQGAFSTGGVVPEHQPNCEIIIGLVQHTFNAFLESHGEHFAFVHFDLDLYEPTKFILDRISNRLRIGTILVFDEISNREPANQAHEQRAFSEFLLAHQSIKVEAFAHRHDDSIAFKVITCA